MAETPQTAQELAAAQETEWGTYVATADIDHLGVRAYNAGSPVPVSNVKRHDYEAQGLVAKVRSKAGQEAAVASLAPVEVAVEAPISLAVPLI